MGVYSFSPAHEGTASRGDPDVEQPGITVLEMRRRPGDRGESLGRARRPRGGSQPTSGRPRGLVRSYYEGLPSMAARAEDRMGESLSEAERAEASVRKNGSGDTNRRKLERRMASASSTRTAARRTRYKDAPFGAPAPHVFGRGKQTRACPGPTQEHGRRRASNAAGTLR